MSAGDWIYFGIDPKCGHVVAAVVDTPAHKSDTAKTVGGFVREGYDVSRRENQEGLTWCYEDCPRMKEVRAAQALKESRRRKRKPAWQS